MKDHREGYWKDWYWNKGGREKVQAKRYIAEYKRLKKNNMEKDDLIEVHLKRRILWWNGEKSCIVRKFSGRLKTIHLEIIDSQGYVVAPFTYYGCDSSEGLLFPIKESIEWIEDIKAKQTLLPKEKKEDVLDAFMEEYKDFCRSEDKMNWIPKKIKNLFQKTD